MDDLGELAELALDREQAIRRERAEGLQRDLGADVLVEREEDLRRAARAEEADGTEAGRFGKPFAAIGLVRADEIACSGACVPGAR